MTTLEELGFILCDSRKVETVRVIFFAKTSYVMRDNNYYKNMMMHIRRTLYSKNIEYEHLIIDWSPEIFYFIPYHEKYNNIKNILYYHIQE